MKPAPLFVAIVGGSGSGKTWLAERLQSRLGSMATRISLDDFYRDRSHLPPQRRAKINFDHPAAIDWKLFHRVLSQLHTWRNARVPAYDFTTHSRRKRPRILKPRSIILVDGLWLLRRPAIRRFFTFRIFLDSPARTRLRRRITRDLLSRGRARASILEQFRNTVEPMHARYIIPQIHQADLLLKGNWGEREAENLAAAIQGLSRIHAVKKPLTNANER